MIRFFLRIIPFWLIGFFAVALLPVTIVGISNQVTLYQELEVAKGGPEPVVQPASNFDDPRNATPGAEVAVSQLVQVTPDLQYLEATGPDLTYLIFMPMNAKRAFVPFVVSNSSDEFLGQIEAARDEAGLVLLRGFLVPPSGQSALRAAVLAQVQDFGLGAEDIIVIDPYRGARSEGLQHNQDGAIFAAAVLFAIQAGLIWMAYSKWRGRRGRKRTVRIVTPMQAASVKAGPWGAPVASTPARSRPRVGATREKIEDGFHDSPIKSPKRWGLF